MSPTQDSTSNPRRRSQVRRRHDVAAGAIETLDGADAGGVTFSVRRLEPQLAWVLAGFVLWLNIVFNANGMAFWLITFFVACVGGWGRMFPARHQGVMFARATLLLLGALLLQQAAGPGGAMGPYAALPVLVVVFYALLLSTRWAVGLVVLTLGVFGLSCWLTLQVVPWQAVLAYIGLLLLIPLIAIQFGRALRQSDDHAESTLRDSRTLLYNEAGFFVHGAVLMAECRRRGRPFCMVLLNGADLLDIPGLLGRKVANDLFTQVVRGIGAVSGEAIAARTDAVEFALLLPGVSAGRAAALVNQQLGDPPKVEVQLHGKPVVIVLDMAIAQAQDRDQGIEELYDGLHARWVVPKATGPKAVKVVPVLGPDDDRVAAPRRANSPTIPMPLRSNQRSAP